MARVLGVECPGARHLVASRGNERRPIFCDVTALRHLCSLLGELLALFGVRIAAWVLMDNHYQVPAGDPGRLPQPPLSVAQCRLQRLVQSYPVGEVRLPDLLQVVI